MSLYQQSTQTLVTIIGILVDRLGGEATVTNDDITAALLGGKRSCMSKFDPEKYAVYLITDPEKIKAIQAGGGVGQ